MDTHTLAHPHDLDRRRHVLKAILIDWHIVIADTKGAARDRVERQLADILHRMAA